MLLCCGVRRLGRRKGEKGRKGLFWVDRVRGLYVLTPFVHIERKRELATYLHQQA